MVYDDGSPQPIEDSFYARFPYGKPIFNYFREEGQLDLAVVLAPEDDIENAALQDNNLNVIKHSPTGSAPHSSAKIDFHFCCNMRWPTLMKLIACKNTS